MRSDNSQHLVAAARKRAAQTRRRAITALRRIADNPGAISFDSVASEAGVSRSWLYAQPDLRAQIEQLRARNHQRPANAAPPERQRATETSLLCRLEAAADRIRRLEQDNQQLRAAHAQALGTQSDRCPDPGKQPTHTAVPQHRHVRDRVRTRHHPRYQGRNLQPGRMARSARDRQMTIGKLDQPSLARDRHHRDQPGMRHEVRLVEHHRSDRKHMR